MIPDVKTQKVEGQKSAMLSLSFLCLFVAIFGCTEHKETSASFSEPVYSKQYRLHSTTAIVTLSETNIPTAGNIQLRVDVHAPIDTEVLLPEPENNVTPFTVADGYTEPVQTLPNGKRLHRRVWILIPGLAGEYIFQSLEIRSGPDTLKTDPISVHVESLLPAGTDSFEIKDIAEPVALLPEEEQQQKLLEILAGAGGVLVVILLLIRLGRRRPKHEVVLSPHQTARLALENLPDDDLEKVHALHALLLQFIESHLQVPTVGKTLDEIITNLPRSVLLGRRYRLEANLRTSDQSRFSHKVPHDFPEQLEQFVREFIQHTEEAP